MKLCFSSLIILGLSILLSSCSKDVVVPEVKTQATTAYTIVNNRVVFRDQTAFTELRNKLVKANQSDLEVWEKQNNFKSLRGTAEKNENEEAVSLRNSFGFPEGLAAIINPLGEYQIGSQIIWYNNGFRHEVTGEQQLALIKQDPANSTLKFSAGKKNIRQDVKVNSVSNRYEGQGADGKFIAYLDLVGVPQQRRYIYETWVYTEEYVSSYPKSQQFYTVLTMGIYLQYKSQDFFGSTVWRETQDYRHINYNFDFSGGCNVPVLLANPATLPSNTHYFGTTNFSNDYYGNSRMYIVLAATDLWAYNGEANDHRYDEDGVYWGYQITGYISQSNPGYTFRACWEIEKG